MVKIDAYNLSSYTAAIRFPVGGPSSGNRAATGVARGARERRIGFPVIAPEAIPAISPRYGWIILEVFYIASEYRNRRLPCRTGCAVVRNNVALVSKEQGGRSFHPTDEDLPVGIPALHPTNLGLSVGAPGLGVTTA